MMVDFDQGNVILGNIIVLTAHRGEQKLSIKSKLARSFGDGAIRRLWEIRGSV